MPAVPPSDFRLYHTNALEVLAGLLAEQVARPRAADDWMRPDVVLVPQFSMRRWLQQTLAERSGICANLRFLTPGEFVDAALDANLGPAPDADRLPPEVLRWRLLQALRGDPPMALAGFLDAADPLKAWSLAGALASAFEKYQAWRRDWLLRWERGADADDWQAALWRRVARGRHHRARRIDDYLRRYGAGSAAAPGGLPPRLFVFACQNVSPDVLQVIVSQARAGEQHFYLHSPARAFWGDLDRWGADYRPADDDSFVGANPLLAAWGQAGRDFVAALGSGEAVAARFELTPFAEPQPDTLLGRLQADVLDNCAPSAEARRAADTAPPWSDADAGGDAMQPDLFAAPAASPWPRAGVDRGDASLQFHACHTRLREVQVLHDQLRALLEAPGTNAQPRLQPRDIAVLAPDIDAYAPHVEAVFGGALGTSRELPYTIADTSALATTPLAAAFLRLVELPLRPLTVADAVELLAVPAIAARFGVDDGARAALQAWLEDAGARWGLDGDDRARHRAGVSSAYTFEFALDRLLLGYATGAEDDIDTVAPLPQLEGQDAAMLDALLRFLALLRDGGARLAGPHPPAGWARELDRLLDAAFGESVRDGADARVLERLRACVAAFADGAALAGYGDAVEHALVLDHLEAELGSADPRAPFLSGGVCFGRMVPMRLIPFRVICLLGMDDGAFPARDGRDPVNRIAQALDGRERRVGDPSRRDADRYLFLQLFASAGRVLYLSWVGTDARDGSAREPSMLVSELLDAAARCHAGDADTVRAALVVRHALQPFSPAAFGAAHADGSGADPRRFSFDARWHAAAASGHDPIRSAPFARAPLPARADEREDDVGLDRLRSALLRPHAAYLREGLGMRLPEDETPPAEHEPFGAPDPLAQYALRQQVFDAWLRVGAAPSAGALHPRLLARALLAPGADGVATLARILDEVAPFAQAALAADFAAPAERLPFALDLGDARLHGALDGVRPQGALRVALRPEGRHGGHALRHGLDWLVASALGLSLHELSAPDKDEPPRVETRTPLPRATAIAALRALLALRRRARSEPLLFLPKSGFALVCADDDAGGLRAARKQWLGEDFVHPEAGEATRIALRGRDPFLDEDAASQKALTATAKAVFAALERGEAFDTQALP